MTFIDFLFNLISHWFLYNCSLIMCILPLCRIFFVITEVLSCYCGRSFTPQFGPCPWIIDTINKEWFGLKVGLPCYLLCQSEGSPPLVNCVYVNPSSWYLHASNLSKFNKLVKLHRCFFCLWIAMWVKTLYTKLVGSGDLRRSYLKIQ